MSHNSTANNADTQDPIVQVVITPQPGYVPDSQVLKEVDTVTPALVVALCVCIGFVRANSACAEQALFLVANSLGGNKALYESVLCELFGVLHTLTQLKNDAAGRVSWFPELARNHISEIMAGVLPRVAMAEAQVRVIEERVQEIRYSMNSRSYSMHKARKALLAICPAIGEGLVASEEELEEVEDENNMEH